MSNTSQPSKALLPEEISSPPETLISVGHTSIHESGTLILSPPLTPPFGHRIAAATRTPPSHTSSLFPRSGKLFLCKPPIPPLSLKNQTIVLSASPEVSIALRILPIPSSMQETIAATT